ncbi:DUF4124 domain-containing protein [Aeromonas cavernicola]|uniref:DUF4124 domain-containing protein n=1 Tax=Aeromonas cavernicola TaxID=1006623 RepID=A0A2H9U3Y2_9GAMM|nr:DUF4124 domain-containing protein [Aeromonas cavernicola]PJG58698.1 DUF4124 domain-containing protein [Aeromonas cavernicola]
MNHKHGVGMLTLLLLTSFSADAAKVYSWVDSNGVTHYTDTPLPGKQAKEVDLRIAPFIGNAPRSVQVSNFNELTGKGAKQAQGEAKLSIALLVPEQGGTLRDNTGNVVFHGQINPAAPTQYDVRLTLNGQTAALVSNNPVIRVENLDRGAHVAQLDLLAKDGTILAKSSPVTFYLHRASNLSAPKPTPKANQG